MYNNNNNNNNFNIFMFCFFVYSQNDRVITRTALLNITHAYSVDMKILSLSLYVSFLLSALHCFTRSLKLLTQGDEKWKSCTGNNKTINLRYFLFVIRYADFFNFVAEKFEKSA